MIVQETEQFVKRFHKLLEVINLEVYRYGKRSY